MASLKEVRNRIVSVNSTQQITKAMKMVAAAKLRRAQDNILQMRPYAQKLGEMLLTVSSASESAADSPLKAVRSVEKVLIIVVTSDRGIVRSIQYQCYQSYYPADRVEICGSGSERKCRDFCHR